MTFLYHQSVSYFARGGSLMYFIFAVSLVAWFIGAEKILFMLRFRNARRRCLDAIDTGRETGTTGIRAFDDLARDMQRIRRGEPDVCSIELTYKEFLITAVPTVHSGLSTMSAWISVAPLLGLLGTVGGMIETFRVITSFGLGNPNLTAEGISIALITTQAGLTVAFPGVILHNYIVNQSRGLVSRLLKDGEELVKRYCPVCRGTSKNGEG